MFNTTSYIDIKKSNIIVRNELRNMECHDLPHTGKKTKKPKKYIRNNRFLAIGVGIDLY